jgi:hypothetical protein
VILSLCRSDSLAEKEAAIVNVNVTTQILEHSQIYYMMPGTSMIGRHE